jgi:SNF2 family DNA or RNA helicase
MQVAVADDKSRFAVHVDNPAVFTLVRCEAERIEQTDDGPICVFKNDPEIVRRFENFGVIIPDLYAGPLVEGLWTPTPYQIETTIFLSKNPRAYCTSDTRTGKTGAVVLALDRLNQMGEPGATLIVSPASVMRGVWGRTIETTLRQNVGICRGTARQREKILEAGYPYYVINFEGLAVVRNKLEEMINKKVITKVVIDELNAYGNPSSKRFRTAERLFNAYNREVKWLWGLTGTPGADILAVYGYCRLVNFDRMPWKYRGAWQLQVQRKTGPMAWMWENKPEAVALMGEVMQPNIRVTREQAVKYLPPVVWSRREAELSREQKEAYTTMRNEMIFKLKSGEVIEATQKAHMLSKLFQIAQGSVVGENGTVNLYCNERLDLLIEIIKESMAKTVIFASFVGSLKMATDYLNKRGVHAVRIDGSVTGRIRDQIFSDFQNTEKYKVLVAHPATTAYGTELAAADQLILNGPLLNGTHTYMQGVSRLSSSKQKSNQIRIIEVTSTREESVFF